jgi:2-polyprenyl-3-methyl-5-hydroxy-6-metoxy-1,4-benzoquinol methylase
MSSSQANESHGKVVATQDWDSSVPFEMGPNTTFTYISDPRRVCFMLSRYKFCAKLLSGKGSVLEIGCGDAFGTPLVAQDVDKILAVDWDAQLAKSNNQRLSVFKNCTFKQHNIVAAPPDGNFDAAYTLDCIEHVDQKDEDAFIRHACANLSDDGTLIVGTPNVASEAYASESSKVGHINLKDAAGLKELLSRYMKTVMIFSMNDEVVHTGFHPMAHYLFAVGIGKKA